MIKSITVKNYLGKEITLELARPEKSGLIVTSVEGLGPAKASINVTDISTNDGGVFKSSRLDKRNIVMKLMFLQSDKETIEDIRQKTYVYFPIKKKVYLTIVTDNRTLKTEGYVESNEPDIFSSQESCTISIICPDPLLYSSVNETTSFSGVEPAFSFPFANNSLTAPLLNMGELQNRTEQVLVYGGNSEIGMTIHIHSLGVAKNITISNVLTGEKMSLNTDRLTAILGDIKLPYPYYCVGSNEQVYLDQDEEIVLNDNGDGTVTLGTIYHGTASRKLDDDVQLYITPPVNSTEGNLFRLRDGQYTFSGCPTRKANENFYVEIRTFDKNRNVVGTYVDDGSGVTFETSVYVEISIHILKDTLVYGDCVFDFKLTRNDLSYLIAGDSIMVTTMRGNKSITLTQNGVTTNILNCLERGSKWFTLSNGTNVFSYDAEEGATNLQFYIENKVAYDGV